MCGYTDISKYIDNVRDLLKSQSPIERNSLRDIEMRAPKDECSRSCRDPRTTDRSTIDDQAQKDCVSLGVNGRGVNRKDHYSVLVFVWTNSNRDDHREEYESLCGKTNIMSFDRATHHCVHRARLGSRR